MSGVDKTATAQQADILARILAKAQQQGLSQQALGLRAGLSRETVSRLKKRNADFGSIARLAAVVGMRLDVVADDAHLDRLRSGLLDIHDFEDGNR